jgi:hypothetical protein
MCELAVDGGAERAGGWMGYNGIPDASGRVWRSAMFDAGTLTFQEFVMREPLPLATIQSAVLEFLRDREDAVVFGAQAVNAYVDEPRMTQDVDLLSHRAPELLAKLGE